MNNGKILGFTTKTFLPNYAEFYEMRQFRPGPDKARVIVFEGEEVLFGPQILYQADRMPELMRHADLETTEGIIRRINEYLDDVEHLYKSVKEFLDDPNVPGKMDFTPHASEVYMTYETIDPDSGKRYRKKELIQDILDKLEPTPLKLTLGIQDPRVTMLKTAEVLNRQLELMAKVKGLITENTVVVNDNSTVTEIIAIARNALRDYPEALEAFTEALLEGGAT